MNIRSILILISAVFALSACQTSQSGISSYGGTSSFAGNSKSPVPNRDQVTVDRSQKRPTALSRVQLGLKAKKEQSAAETATDDVVSAPKSKSKKRSTKLSARKAKYKPIIAKHARANGVPLRLAMAVVEVESTFKPNARGGAGEVGLMQILPRTARGIGYKGPMKALYNPDTNIRYGMKYLGKAYKLGGGTSCGAILKYNAGHYAKKMNPISREYCRRVARIMSRG